MLVAQGVPLQERMTKSDSRGVHSQDLSVRHNFSDYLEAVTPTTK